MIASGWRKFPVPVAPPSPTFSHAVNAGVASSSTNGGNATSGSSRPAAAVVKFRSNASTISDCGSCGIVSPLTSPGSECSTDAASCSSEDVSGVRRRQPAVLEWNRNADDRTDGNWNEALLSWCKVVGQPPMDDASASVPPPLSPLSLPSRKRASHHMEGVSSTPKIQRSREPIKAREVCEPAYAPSKLQARERMSPIVPSRQSSQQLRMADVKQEIDETLHTDEGPAPCQSFHQFHMADVKQEGDETLHTDVGPARCFQSDFEGRNLPAQCVAPPPPKQFIAVPIWPVRSVGKHNIDLEEVLMDLRSSGESSKTSNKPDKWAKLFSSMGLQSQPLMPQPFTPWNGWAFAGPPVPDPVIDQEKLEAMQWYGSLRKVEVVPETPPKVTDSLIMDRDNLIKVMDSYQQIHRWSRGAELEVAPGDSNAQQSRLLIHGSAPKVHFAMYLVRKIIGELPQDAPVPPMETATRNPK